MGPVVEEWVVSIDGCGKWIEQIYETDLFDAR